MSTEKPCKILRDAAGFSTREDYRDNYKDRIDANLPT